MTPRSPIRTRIASASLAVLRLLSGDVDGRRLARIVGPAILASLLSLSLACVGLDQPGGQEPVNDAKARHEKWIVDVGGLPEGTIGPPLIVAPVHDDTVSGTIDVSGWSVTAEDAGADADARAIVHLYVAPADADLGAHEVATIEADAKNGEWKTQLSSADVFAGQTAIGARTEIVGFGASDITRIVVNSNEGTADPKKSGKTAEETLTLVCVMARTKDAEFGDGDEAAFKKTVGLMASYWNDTSGGKLAVTEGTWVTGSGDGLVVDSYSGSEYLSGVLDNEEVRKAIPAQGAFSVVVFIPAGSDPAATAKGFAAWSMGWPSMTSDLDLDRRGSFIHVVENSYATLAHEMAHGLGTYRAAERDAIQLPDLYHFDWLMTFGGWLEGKEFTDEEYYGVGSYSNLGMWTTGNYFLMGGGLVKNPRIPTLDGFSQHWMGWLDYYPTPSGSTSTLAVPNISRGDISIDKVPTLIVPEDDRSAYVVLEGRSLSHEFFTDKKDGILWPGDGVIAYKMRELSATEKATAASEGYRGGGYWPRSIDYITRLDDWNPDYVDFGDDYVIELEKRGFDPEAAVTKVKTRPVQTLDYVVESLKSGLTFTGLSMVTNMTGLPALAIAGVAASPSENAQDPGFPDLDLHAYLADGTHVGMDYETGKFENPAEAIVSGDRSMDDEWILLPPEVAETARFEISARDAKEYAERTKTEPLQLDYAIQPVAYDEAEQAAAKGAEQPGKLKAGDSASMTLRSEDGTLAVEPADGDGEGGGAMPLQLDDRGEMIGMLAAAGVLVLAGLVLLVVPLRRRRT